MLAALTLALLSQTAIDGGLEVRGDMTVFAPYYLTAPYARHSIIYGWGAGGLVLRTSQMPWDINATVEIQQPQGRTAGQAWVARNGPSTVVGQLEWNGQLTAGGQGAPAAFLSQGGPFACQAGASGCYAALYGGMLNKGFHGAVVLGNGNGNPARDGGLSLQVLGIGKTNSYAGTVLAQDVYGNLETFGGLIGNYLEPKDFDTCQVTPGFDNPTPALDSPGGFFRPRGMWGYNRVDDWVQLCTARSAQRDGGYERLCTDSNDACDELPPGVTVTTNNDAAYIRLALPDGGSRTVVLPWGEP